MLPTVSCANVSVPYADQSACDHWGNELKQGCAIAEGIVAPANVLKWEGIKNSPYI